MQSVAYSAISCDICDLHILRVQLERAGVDFTAPTLLMSECVLTYINATRYILTECTEEQNQGHTEVFACSTNTHA